uniref:Uncharacterized protein n=1 Tax=Arion vulgaris TaxID=1028688 RepID=A0A0B6ZLQ3_9EUPU
MSSLESVINSFSLSNFRLVSLEFCQTHKTNGDIYSTIVLLPTQTTTTHGGGIYSTVVAFYTEKDETPLQPVQQEIQLNYQ